MKRQRLRKLLLIAYLLLFPITLYYFSPVLIINEGLKRIIKCNKECPTGIDVVN